MTTRQTEEASRPPRAQHPSADRNPDRASTSSVTDPIESLVRTIGIDNVYGPPVTQGDTTVVPVAEVRTGFGVGSGPDAADTGGGAGLRITPRGYLEITDDGARYQPIYSYTPFVVGAAVLGGLLYRLL
ncbi:MAG: spore germination protein GerW family protein, partial [Salinivenus sp.]